jgi:photosystem II stability/assembly factor-like uncharacterized protein
LNGGHAAIGLKARARFRRAAAFICLVLGFAGATVPATADDSVVIEMMHPAILTPRAAHGLIISIARAGDRLVAVGERGRILISDDNGKSWRQIATPTSVTLTQVRFATPAAGWAVGQMGVVLHTADGGLTWAMQFDGVRAGQVMLAAANADIAAHGTNDATTANLQSAEQTVAAGANVPFLTILPLSAENLLLAGAFGMAFSSTDGGATWHSIADNITDPGGLHIYDLIDDNGVTYATGEQGLVLTGSFAGPFSVIATPFQGSFFGALMAPDKSLIVYGLQGTVLRSADQGKDWAQPVSGADSGIDCGLVLQNGDILLGDIAGDLLLSRDDGKSFTVSQAPQPVAGLAQAADGSVILAGPFGVVRLSPAALNAGA